MISIPSSLAINLAKAKKAEDEHYESGESVPDGKPWLDHLNERERLEKEVFKAGDAVGSWLMREGFGDWEGEP